MSRGTRKLTHGPATWFALLSGSLSMFYGYLHKDQVPWEKFTPFDFALSLFFFFLNMLCVSIFYIIATHAIGSISVF